jgi:hypothetical protein
MFAFYGDSVHHPRWVIVIKLYIENHLDHEIRKEILQWLKDNCRGSYSTGLIYSVVNPHFYFAQKDDAALFKLTWGGK